MDMMKFFAKPINISNMTRERSLFAALFAPAAFFLILGALAIVAPELIIALFAGLFIFIGAALAFAAWKFMQIKGKFDEAVKNYQGRIIVHGFDNSDFETEMYLSEEDEDDDPNITFH